MNKRIIEYKIVTVRFNSDELGEGEFLERLMERKVNEAICEGWQPIGGVQFSDQYGEYAQAMVKYDTGRKVTEKIEHRSLTGGT